MALQVLESIPAREWEGLSPCIRAGRFITTATCEECGVERDWSTRSVHEPRIAVTRAHKAGWQTGKHVVCPDCITKKKMEKRAMNEATSKVAPIRPEPSDAAKRAKRLVYMALEDYYDDAKKAYRSGYCDASIAEEIGCAEAFVAKIREEDFGPLAEPEEVAVLRAEVAALRAEAVEAGKAAQEAVAAARKLQEAVERVSTELATMARRNGWRQ